MLWSRTLCTASQCQGSSPAMWRRQPRSSQCQPPGPETQIVPTAHCILVLESPRKTGQAPDGKALYSHRKERRFTPSWPAGGAPSKGHRQQGAWPPCTRLVRLQKAPTRPWTLKYSTRGVCLRLSRCCLGKAKWCTLNLNQGKTFPQGAVSAA